MPSDASRLELTLLKISCIFSAYGRMRVIASWARFSFAALTIFMAEVICMVLFTEVMRKRISLRFAIVVYSETVC